MKLSTVLVFAGLMLLFWIFIFSLVQNEDLLFDTEKIVVLDPGHGGEDRGALYCEDSFIVDGKIKCNSIVLLSEAEMALDIAKKTQQILQDEDFTVILTRDNDTTLTLDERSDFAKKNFANIFISIHGNVVSLAPCADNGTETYYHPRSETSLEFSEILQKKVTVGLGTIDRGIKPLESSSFFTTIIPNSKLEVGFICNPNDYDLLKKSNNRQKVAIAISESVKQYFNLPKN